MNNPLQDKLNELVEQLREAHKKIEDVMLDPTFINDECSTYTDACHQHAKLVKRIWVLKQNWEG